MPWRGPYIDGVSQTLLNRFLICPFRFYIHAILGLEEPRTPEPNLVWGDTFHKGLELLLSLPVPSYQFSQAEWDHIDASIDKHLEQYIPSPPSFPHSIKRMLRLYNDSYKLDLPPILTEKKFTYKYGLPGHLKPLLIRGKYDGLAGTTLIEHKCKGYTEPQQARQETRFDLQVNLYSSIQQLTHFFASRGNLDHLPLSDHRTTHIIYDIIKIPDTQWGLPQRRMSQTVKHWVSEWYDTKETDRFPITRKKHLWLDQFPIFLSTDDLRQHAAFTLNPILEKLIIWWEWVTQSGFDFENPKYYNDVFYRTPIRHFNPSNTQSFKPEYFEYLTGQGTLEDLRPIKNYFPELDEEPPSTL